MSASNKPATAEFDSLLFRNPGGSGSSASAASTSVGASAGTDMKSGFGSTGSLMLASRDTTHFADPHDLGSVSDSGVAATSRAKFKRTRRALHLKPSDRERLRGPFKGLDWRKRTLAIEVLTAFSPIAYGQLLTSLPLLCTVLMS
jgi:hypothetical protein